jgi:predicted TIM-barrel fold metal-dependent hydrolase
MRLIDMDTHFAPDDEFAYAPQEFQALAPRWVPQGDGRVVLVAPGRPEPTTRAGAFNPSVRLPGNYDVAARLKDMETLGVERQMLNPEFSEYCYETDPRLAVELCRSANIAVAKVLKTYPDRFLGSAIVPTQDSVGAAEEAQHAIELGFHSLFMKSPQGGKNFGDRHFWPLYEVAHRHQVPICVHGTTLDPGSSIKPGRLGAHWGVSVGMLTDFLVCVCSLIYDGVFDAYPNLRFCFAESGATWLLWLWDRLALTYQEEPNSRAKTAKHPTEYFASNVWVTVDPTEQGLGYLCERLGSKNLMLGTDYPHGDITGRRRDLGALRSTHIDLLLQRDDLSPEAKEDIAYRNALRFLGDRVN